MLILAVLVRKNVPMVLRTGVITTSRLLSARLSNTVEIMCGNLRGCVLACIPGIYRFYLSFLSIYVSIAQCFCSTYILYIYDEVIFCGF